ncbi:thioredoxin family protein [Stenotrophomonas maltophilia]|uniref:thioredoxin family protein n=1 Tax=Stenotrophomonas maltophilia TaxID=40324 RepID=UPI002893AB66|nr:thioredoxin family protein [Stenotrophomonas maltophilia]MDT3499590.1 thioredoxin family protein [Stenotrophomonas maltophilia]
MPFMRTHLSSEPSRAEVEAHDGWQLLEFGASWCGHCQAAQPALQEVVEAHDLAHWKIEDGKGRALGRSFQVKLWPTVILLHEGREVARVVRPRVRADLATLEGALPG